MYEELVKSLRQCAEASCAGCKNDLVEIGCRGKLQIEAADAIEELSKERKKGKWIKMSDADGIYWACSECGEDVPRVPHYDPQFDLFPRLKSIKKTKFCPNCGARMEVETE